MWSSRHTAPRSDAGFTLLELFITISLLSLFIGAVYEAMIVGLRSVNASDDRETIRQQLTAALDQLTREAEVADDVDEATSIEFQVDTPSASNAEYVYDSTAGTLTRDDTASAPQVTLRNLTALDFDYIDCGGTSHTGSVAEASEDTLRVMQVTATVARDTETLSMTAASFLHNMIGDASGTCGGL